MKFTLGQFDKIASAIQSAKASARKGLFDGRQWTPYCDSCRRVMRFDEAVIIIALTRDVGYHSSGWWKNPDYERCWHLSISIRDPELFEPLPMNHRFGARVAQICFGHSTKMAWHEGPWSESGKKGDVHHYRVFCNEAWQPIMPRREVYNRELTEAGWNSFSDLQAAIESGSIR